jgi:hypothetical protein
MISLKVGRLKLKHDVEQDNKSMVQNLNRKFRYRVAKTLGISPEHALVTTLYDALTRGVKEFKTTDRVLLNKSREIESEYRMKVINAAKSEAR